MRWLRVLVVMAPMCWCLVSSTRSPALRQAWGRRPSGMMMVSLSEPLVVTAGLVPEGAAHASEDLVAKTHQFDVTVEAPLGIKLRETSEGSRSVVVVSGVSAGGGAAAAGCRVGDRVVATSATIGDAMWPKTTLAGIESALRSRLRLATLAGATTINGTRARKPSVRLRLERSFDEDETAMSVILERESVVENWDVALSKPLGLTLKETSGGLIVTGVRKGGSAYDDGRIREGDRIRAVSRGWGGDRMVDCDSVEAVVKAASSQQEVTLRLERLVAVGTFRPSPEEEKKDSESESSSESAASLVRAAAERRVAADVGRAVLAYRELAKSNVPGRATASLLLERCCALCRSYASVAKVVPDGEYGQAFAVASLDALVAALQGVPLSAKLLTNALASYSSIGRPDKAIELYERAVEGRGPTEAARLVNCQLATAAITAYGRLGQTEAAFDVIARRPSSATIVRAPDSTLCNALLAVAVKAGDGRAERLFAATRRPGGVDEFFYGLRTAASDIAFFEKDDDDDDDAPETTAAALADAVTYNIMVNYHARAKRPAEAERVVSEMREAGLTPGRVAYTTLVKAYAEARMPDEARHAFDALADVLGQDRAPDVAAWNTLVRSYGVAMRWRDALAVVDRMRDRRVEPNLLTYTNLATAAMRANQPRVALDALRQLDDAYDAVGRDTNGTAYGLERKRSLLRPNVVSFTIEILANAKLGDLQGAIDALRRMRDCRVRPNARTYAALLEACLAANKPRAGQALADDMRRVPGVEDVVTRTLLLKCHLRARDASLATALLDEMESSTRLRDRPNLVTYNAAIDGFFRLGLYDKALDALRAAARRFTPNKATWAALARADDPEFLYSALSALADAKKHVALLVYDAFLAARASPEACERLARRREAGDLVILYGNANPRDEDTRLRRLERTLRGHRRALSLATSSSSRRRRRRPGSASASSSSSSG
ncbi:hypothetical protein CTAYLR_004658 [Chrysophaeum taylorii]|uniref:PDZ domain-containing protein n=1 Tax=Chrysophaeum taylorii TaxID=2483200 RepID=A0AAD7U9F9_9STRA|nr:hypothetical protein CTAYLR_004658 [Chrysophaeum taylorii]